MIIRGPLLNPLPNGSVDYWPDGALWADEQGRTRFVGAWSALPKDAPIDSARRSEGILLPPFLDCHTHIPQYPIRGRFTEGVEGDPPEGRLLAGLNRNVFPLEAKAAGADHATSVVHAFAENTLAQGVVGGATYMTVHPEAAWIALETLPAPWSVGLVLMDQNCPAYLRTDALHLERDVAALAEAHGQRLILTDRFAVAVGTPLRSHASRLAERWSLRMQTHLNEQRAEKAFVERSLYPDYESYTDVYRRDGLLAHAPLLAHCIQMTPPEWSMLVEAATVGAAIVHCPTSNTLLGSGTMSLATVAERGIPYALCTDVGASPTTSLLAEMAQFLKVHAAAGGESAAQATPSEALYRVTVAPAQILGLGDTLGTFAIGKPLSFVEVEAAASGSFADADSAILAGLLGLTLGDLSDYAASPELRQLAQTGLPDGPALAHVTEDVHHTARRLENRVIRVTREGSTVWERNTQRPANSA